MEIKIKGLKKTYQLRKNVLTVLEHLDLNIQTDEKTVIVGKSGCGKTTFLHILAQLTTCNEGKITGTESVRIGYVFQEDRLFPWLTVCENVMLPMRKSEKGQERAKELLEIMGLSEFAKGYPGQLSGGMRKKASLARCPAYEPEFLLMDEPFAGLDYFTRKKLQDELLDIIEKEKKGLLLVTHDIEEALKIADKICVMKNGKISRCFVVKGTREEREFFTEEMRKTREEILHEIE